MQYMEKKVALVTGASSGIGKATVRQLLADGLEVYAAARRVERMRELEADGAHVLAMDITREEDIQRVVETIRKQSGGVDVLVNNAGFGLYGAVEDVPIDDARYQFEVNLFGLASLTQKLLPGMRAKGKGTIINITSIGGKIYFPLGAWYHASKHALEGWSDCLRLEVKDFGIDVVIVEPGVINTEFGDVMMPMLEKYSGQGAYAELVQMYKKATGNVYEQQQGSPPEVIAQVISKAVRARRPRTRYVAGSMARPMLFLRWLLSDRLFDGMIMSTLRRYAKG
ncbi:MAG: oxidoreductase [Bacteroidetes bacterium]|nr:MAG: oxidoreductase [Bacteroidota bacterium]